MNNFSDDPFSQNEISKHTGCWSRQLIFDINRLIAYVVSACILTHLVTVFTDMLLSLADFKKKKLFS